ncbi:MAG: hypothetical protein NTY66_04165, partial [Candidatus Vogelbacteria bacterium]|nr:hypothetical protein [Candidatus Vogelbacteria bacterium]
RGAKKAIATFKTRQGDVIGYAVTLRGKRMFGFLEKLWNIAFPRTRDFKGFDEKSLDELGNLTIGLRENVIFPETADDDIKDTFGKGIPCSVTTWLRKSLIPEDRSSPIASSVFCAPAFTFLSILMLIIVFIA